MNSYDSYQSAKKLTEEAHKWVGLRTAVDSQSRKLFWLSPAHSKFMLMRCGQHSAGGTNYWQSPEMFNSAMLEVIASRFDELSAAVMDILEEREQTALIACEEELQEIQAQIQAAKNPALTP